jgi:hypothetical protein
VVGIGVIEGIGDTEGIGVSVTGTMEGIGVIVSGGLVKVSGISVNGIAIDGVTLDRGLDFPSGKATTLNHPALPVMSW